MISLRKPSIIGLVVVAIAFLLMYVYESRGPNAESQRFDEIQKLWATLPLYPGMVQVDRSSNSSGRKASVGAKFRSDASYEDVRRFYMEKLKDDGWSFHGEKLLNNWGRNEGGKELEWRRNEYQLSVEYAGQSGFEWTYAVGIYWEN